MIGADLLRFSDRKIIVFDAETQRLNLMHDNLPFQWSYVVTQKGRILSRHNHYLKWPGFKMSEDAARITRFQQHWVDNGEDPRKVLARWEEVALNEDYLLAGHNIIGFDWGVWQLWRAALGLPPDWSAGPRLLDTHLLSRAYQQGWKPDRANLLAWQHKVAAAWEGSPKTGLAHMAKLLEVPADESRTHDATYDVEINAAILWKLVNKLEL